MEPSLKKKEFKNQKKIIIIVSILVVSLFIGSSFSLLSNSDETEEVVNFKTGDLNMEVSTTDTLSLAGELPKSYNEGFNNKDITLTLKNTGSLEIGKYEVKLEGDSTSNLNNKYIKYSVSEDNGTTYLAAKTLSDTNNIIYTGYSLKDTKVLKVKLWITEDADEEVLKKIYNGKIKVELYQNEDTLVDVVKSKLVSNYSGSNESFSGGVVAVNNKGELYHEENDKEIREYRYSGPNVNNYVTFNDEEWRIIGVFKDEENIEHVKIVRNNALTRDMFPETYTIKGTIYNIKYKDSGDYAYWNNKINYNNDWATSGLQYWLNTESDETDEQPNKGYISKLKTDTLSMIEETKYYLGTVTYKYTDSSNYGIIDSPKEAYANERAVSGCEGEVGPEANSSKSAVEDNAECRVWQGNKATWIGKVALLYPSDYGFSADSSSWNIDLLLGSFDKGPSDTSWLQKTANHGNEWLLSPSSNGLNFAAGWITTGRVDNNNVSNFYRVRPALYLKNNVKITSGDGTSTNPFKLDI